MSFNRENVAWESKDGTWSIGFFSFYETGDSYDDDYDSEWDVDYYWDSFWYVSTGHRTQDEAYAAYTRYHGNPGGGWVSEYKGNSAQNKKYDAMAYAFKNPEEAKKLAEKKKRSEFRKAQAIIAAAIAADDNFWSNRLSVNVSQKHEPYELHYGAYSNLTGVARLVGDWRVLEGVRVYNEKTKKVAPLIRSVEKVKRPTTMYSGRRW